MVYRNVVVANDGTLVAGHGVVQAARELGQTTPWQALPYGPDPRVRYSSAITISPACAAG